MQRKRKVLWICISSICLGIILMGLVLKFSFKLKTVDVEIQMSLQNESKLEINIKDKLKEYFNFGENIILMEFDETIKEIEKNHPYVKVNQVIKSFPNIVRVYISERISKYKVADSENSNIWYILDSDFKVIRKIAENEEKGTDFENSVEIEDLKISKNVGEFLLNNETVKNNLNSILTGVYGDTEDYSVVKSIKIVEIKEKNDFDFYLTMKNIANQDEQGCKILISGTADLVKKSNAGMSTYLNAIVSEGLYPNIPSTTITIRFDGENYVGTII